MATAPNLQAEGTLNAVTTGNLTLTLPTHATNDILVCTLVAWLPSTVGSLAVIPDLADWTKASFVQFPGTPDGEIAFFWRRATASGTTNPTFTRGASWDTGTDGIYAGRAYVVRGCTVTGNPWDEIDPTAALTAANGAVDAVTVSGPARTVIQFLTRSDDYSTAPSLSGWTAGTAVEDTTGTDCSFRTFLKTPVAADTAADTSANEAPAAGAYVFFGVSFIPSNSDLVVADATQAQTTDAIALTQVHVLAVADATQAQTTDAIALTQVHELAVQDATQAQTVDNLVIEEIVPSIDLTVQDATQAQSTDSITLTQVHNLAVADATQAQTTDGIALTQVHALVVQDASQAQTVDNLDLTQVHVLAIQDATQAQTVDSVVIDAGGASSDLVVQDASQAQTVDNVTLTQVHNLTVGDATQAQTVDNIDIDASGAIPLTVQDATHAQTVDTITLAYIRVQTELDASNGLADLDASQTGQDNLDGSTSATSVLDATPTQSVLVAS